MFKNTLWVYSHKFSTALITLVSTPVLLSNLGVEDYGIYSLTIGVVAVFNFINWSLTAATQRFIAVSIGKEDKDELNSVFNNSFFIHLAYSAFLLLIILSVGVFFTDTVLNIPMERLKATQYVLIFVSLITFFQILAIPYQGLLKAFENFKIVSIFGVLDSVLKLIAAFLLYIAPIDKLVFFSLLMASFSLIIFLLISIYAHKKYEFLRLSKTLILKQRMVELFNFISWNIIGALAILGRNQGIGVVLNLFFGVVLNAAYGVALQVQAAIGVFSQGIITSMSPRILKEAGKNDIDKMIAYSNAASKYGLFVISFVGIPLVIYMDTILNLWLMVVPENAIIFSQLIVIFIFTTGFSVGLQTVFHGINKVKLYNLWVSLILILNIPLAFLGFSVGLPPYTIFFISIVLEIVSFFTRLILLKKYISFQISNYLKTVFREVLIPVILTFLLVLIFNQMLLDSLNLFLLGSLLSTISLSLIIFFFSLTHQEKSVILSKIKPLMQK
ncbi:oligosaccharide flippase family protein [Shivajiella indica]|uniref:Oligosaccharide flippase family protein n=1 Tax=Shivajiella indica TaxID=872115 RepID=A0ABW5B9H7_9BACT